MQGSFLYPTIQGVHPRIPALSVLLVLVIPSTAVASSRIRILPADGSTIAVWQRFDVGIQVETEGEPPPAVTVLIDGQDVSGRQEGEKAPRSSSQWSGFLLRDVSATAPGTLTIEVRTDTGTAVSRLTVEAWQGDAQARARNIILLVGDGMGAAHRTAARLVSRGVRNGRANGRLAMDTMDVTGMVMTGSLNAIVTDSSPGMAAYVTGQKSNNNQQGVFPDQTEDAFDNPRVEYLGALLRRTRGEGFNVGIVTTADVTDSTPAANAVHTSDRYAGAGIASRYFDERATNGVAVLLGGGSRHFLPKSAGGTRQDQRQLVSEFAEAGFTTMNSGTQLREQLTRAMPPARLLGLFHPSHLPVAFDKVGAGRYSDELALPRNVAYRDTPMLDDMTRVALRSLAAHSADGFYLMVEGASIDKRAHAADAERSIWDVIEFDRAVHVALEFAGRTNSDGDPGNDTLVIVTADHECGGLAILGVGNERYAPQTMGTAVRDYAAQLRFAPEQRLELTPNYVTDAQGYPTDPDPSRKLLVGWAAAPDRYENWLSNRTQAEAAVVSAGTSPVARANPDRDGPDGRIPGFHVPGVIENGETGCPADDGCPADTASVPHTTAGHTATDVPLSASGPGAWQFTGVYENADVFLKILRAASGYPLARPDAR